MSRRGATDSVWTPRRRRVERLRGEHPHAGEMLAFYGDMLALQQPLYERALASRWLGPVEAAAGDLPRLRLSRLPPRPLDRAFRRFVRAVPGSATDVLRATAGRLASAPDAASELLRAALAAEPTAAIAEALDAEPAALAFFPRAFVQPVAEALAARTAVAGADEPLSADGGSPGRHPPDAGSDESLSADGGSPGRRPSDAGADARRAGDGGTRAGGGDARAGGGDARAGGGAARAACPYCGGAPIAAVLRDEPEIKGRRTLLCSLCLAEWAFPRTRCPACGEERADRRPHHVSESWPHVRVEECGSCRTYVKAIDLRETGLAVPVVDELASVELDLWAAEQGLSKLRTNLLGL